MDYPWTHFIEDNNVIVKSLFGLKNHKSRYSEFIIKNAQLLDPQPILKVLRTHGFPNFSARIKIPWGPLSEADIALMTRIRYNWAVYVSARYVWSGYMWCRLCWQILSFPSLLRLQLRCSFSRFNQIIQQLLGKMGLDRKLCTTDFSRILRAFLRWILKILAESAHYPGVTIEMRLSIRMMVMIHFHIKYSYPDSSLRYYSFADGFLR